MLKDAHDVRVRGVLIRAIKMAVSKSLISAGHIALVDAHFNELVHERIKVWERHIRFVQELRKNLTID
jgi:hypothetical protein